MAGLKATRPLSSLNTETFQSSGVGIFQWPEEGNCREPEKHAAVGADAPWAHAKLGRQMPLARLMLGTQMPPARREGPRARGEAGQRSGWLPSRGNTHSRVRHGCGQNQCTHVHTDATRVRIHAHVYIRDLVASAAFTLIGRMKRKSRPSQMQRAPWGALAKGPCPPGLAGIGWSCSNTARTPRVLGTGCKRPEGLAGLAVRAAATATQSSGALRQAAEPGFCKGPEAKPALSKPHQSSEVYFQSRVGVI